MNVPAQFAIPVPNLAPGMPLILYRIAEVPNPDGSKMKVWPEVDDGVVGTDGIARSDPEPAPGPAREGDYGIAAFDIGQIRVMRGHIVLALPLAALAGAVLALNPIAGGIALAAFAGLAGLLMHLNFGNILLIIR
jgi:hypothetical protein